MSNTMPVAERIQILKHIFKEFGINVVDNSSLDLAIRAEFGRGKRSALNKILQDLTQSTDAATLAAHIGVALGNNTSDPQLIAISRILQQRLPNLLSIFDIKQQCNRREQLLAQLLEHFMGKLPNNAQSERLLRMLKAAKENLHATVQVQSLGKVIEYSGAACDFSELTTYGRILQIVTPALVILDQDSAPLELKINHCINALRGIGYGLRHSNLQCAANIIENIHDLAQVSLPSLSTPVNVEQALNSMGISIGSVATQQIITKAQQTGLTSQEITQMLYFCEPNSKLPATDLILLHNSQKNQQYAAICGYIAKLAREIEQPQLEKIGIAGLCLAGLRQTYYEIKTNNLNAVNFSESLGTILNGVGIITNNSILQHIGKGILEGLKAYSGIMAVPGGAAIAIPVALCSVLGKVLLDTKTTKSTQILPANNALHKILEAVVHLQKANQQELSKLHSLLRQQHRDLLLALEHGFNSIDILLKSNNLHNLQALQQIDQHLDTLQYSLNKEFADWYLEYVREPLEAIDFATKYG